jgi:hypothetical protein
MAAVEGRVGRLYMAYLATYLSQRPELDMEPITDQPRYFEALGDPLTMATARELDRIRSIVVRDVLPCPHGHVDPADLAKFKEQHRDLLLPFRRQVEDCVLRCAMYDDREMRRRTAREAAAGFRDQADEIERRLAERRWPTRMGSFCALLGGLPASIGGLVTGHPEIAVAAASAPLVAEFVRHRFDGCDALPSTAYAVLAREAFP